MVAWHPDSGRSPGSYWFQIQGPFRLFRIQDPQLTDSALISYAQLGSHLRGHKVSHPFLPTSQRRPPYPLLDELIPDVSGRTCGLVSPLCIQKVSMSKRKGSFDIPDLRAAKIGKYSELRLNTLHHNYAKQWFLSMLWLTSSTKWTHHSPIFEFQTRLNKPRKPSEFLMWLIWRSAKCPNRNPGQEDQCYVV